MGRKSKYTDEQKAAALADVDRGVSCEEAGRRIGASGPTVSRWRSLRDHGTPRPPVAARAKAFAILDAETPPADEDEDEDDPTDTLGLLRRIASDMQTSIKQAKRVGNMSAMQKAGRDLAGLMATIARVERQATAAADYLTIRREEIAEARAAVLTRVEALASRPLHCAACARKLAVEWGREGRPEKGEDE